MLYIDRVGGEPEALAELKANGGQMFSAKDKSTFSVIRGSYCFTFKPHDYQDAELKAVADKFGISKAGLTEGRLAGRFVDSVLGIKSLMQRSPQRYFGQCIRNMSQDGKYWGFTYSDNQPAQDLIEFDIESAYGYSLASMESFCFHEPYSWKHKEQAPFEYMKRLLTGHNVSESESQAWIKDGGALARWREYMPLLPKTIRLRCLGIIAQKSFTPVQMQDGKPTAQKIHQIKTGCAYNAVHLAVLRLYYLMGIAQKMLGEYCVRAHTDGFTISCHAPLPVVESLIQFFSDRGLRLRAKKVGFGKIWDHQSGFLGNFNFIGSPFSISRYMREEGLKFRKADITDQIAQKWALHLCTHKFIGRDRIAYGYFQTNYSPNGDGVLTPDGGTFYCFACSLDGDKDTNFITHALTETQVLKSILKN